MTQNEMLFLAGVKAGAGLRLDSLSDETILGLVRREFDRAICRIAPPEVVICAEQPEPEKDNTPKRGRPRREQ